MFLRVCACVCAFVFVWHVRVRASVRARLRAHVIRNPLRDLQEDEKNVICDQVARNIAAETEQRAALQLAIADAANENADVEMGALGHGPPVLTDGAPQQQLAMVAVADQGHALAHKKILSVFSSRIDY